MAEMTKSQARNVYFAGAGHGPTPDSLTKMVLCARFEQWWQTRRRPKKTKK